MPKCREVGCACPTPLGGRLSPQRWRGACLPAILHCAAQSSFSSYLRKAVTAWQRPKSRCRTQQRQVQRRTAGAPDAASAAFKTARPAHCSDPQVLKFRLNQSRISMRCLFSRVKSLEEENRRLQAELQSITGRCDLRLDPRHDATLLRKEAACYGLYFTCTLSYPSNFSLYQVPEGCAVIAAAASGAHSVSCRAPPRSPRLRARRT